jgi:hypothetical protein
MSLMNIPLLTKSDFSDTFRYNCCGAYSLKLINNYIYHILSIRKESDNSIINFKADPAGNLFTFNNIYIADNISIDVILANEKGFINTWYDQSGNNNHLMQDNYGLQPYLDITTKTIIFNGNSWLYRKPGLFFNGIKNYTYSAVFMPFNNNSYSLCEHNTNTLTFNQRSSLCVDNNYIGFKGENNNYITSTYINPFNYTSAIIRINNSTPIECNKNIKININNNDTIIAKTGDDIGFRDLYLNNYGFTIGIKLSTLTSENYNGMYKSLLVFNNDISDEDVNYLSSFQMNNLT